MWDVLSMTALMVVGIVLMFVILLQRGRGGGLAGAFGGLGGQSAFGTKAGDVFTKITVVLTVIWVILAGVSSFALRAGAEKRYSNVDEEAVMAPAAGEPAEGAGTADESDSAATPATSDTGAGEPEADADKTAEAPAGDEAGMESTKDAAGEAEKPPEDAKEKS